jgi:aspartate/methionine/tyrosine aminotransferase
VSFATAARMQGVERTLIRRIFDSAPPGSINLGLGQPDLPTPAGIALAGIEGIASGRTGYTSTAGDPALREAIARRYPGIARDGADVVVTIGSQEAVFVSVLTLVDPGTEVLVPDPGYPAYPVLARLAGATPVAYPLRPERRFRVDPDDVLRLLTERTRLVILCSPSNPTGAIDDDGDLARLAAILAERNVPWLSDEIYAGFAYDREATSIARHARGGGLVVSGLSKDLSMTGWRIGWAVGPEPLVARLIACHQYVATCASSVSQAAALAAVSPSADAERRRYLEIFRRRRAVMLEALSAIPGVSVTPPDGAFYVFLDVRPFGSSLAIAERVLTRRRVITIPGEAFGPGGAGFLRISYAASEADIRAGIAGLARELVAGGAG